MNHNHQSTIDQDRFNRMHMYFTSYTHAEVLRAAEVLYSQRLPATPSGSQLPAAAVSRARWTEALAVLPISVLHGASLPLERT